MEEHQGRYTPFAEFLQKHGYTVVTADMRGHGEHALTLSHIADRDGARLLIEDEEFKDEGRDVYMEEVILHMRKRLGTENDDPDSE